MEPLTCANRRMEVPVRAAFWQSVRFLSLLDGNKNWERLLLSISSARPLRCD